MLFKRGRGSGVEPSPTLQENVETQNMVIEINREDAGRMVDPSTESEV